MRKVPVSSLRPDMVIARPVYGADGQMFLNSGMVLKGPYISSLVRLGVQAVYVEDPLLGDIVVSEVVKEETRQNTVKAIKDILLDNKKIDKSKSSIVNKKFISLAEKLVEEVLSNKEVIVNLSDIRITDDYTYYHSVNVCIISLLAATGMKVAKGKLEELCIGALLHDMGKVWIDNRILNKNGSLTPEEFDEIKKHPGFGFDILSKQRDISSLSSSIVIQHHERCDGNGYPGNLTKNQIHYFSRLVMVVDVYDALVSHRPYRPAFKPHEAIEMITSSADIYDPEMVQQVLNHIAAYPVGTAIRLSNGDLALDVENRKSSPLRPLIRVCKDGDGSMYQHPFDIDLMDKLDLVITDVLDDELRDKEIPITQIA